MFKLPETAQEIFDKVARHLLTQNARCVDTRGDCKYRLNTSTHRGVENLKCAVGCLIPDEAYSPHIEGKAWGVLVDEFGFPKDHEAFIASLQFLHDKRLVGCWKSELLGISITYRLDRSILDEFSESTNDQQKIGIY